MSAQTWWGFPKQIANIVGNEACERFSYYGMRSILVVFMMDQLLFAEHEAKGIYHLFMAGSYFMPLIGGYLSDRFFGKYRTILWLSLVYCLGHAVLAVFESRTGLYVGLVLVAVGAGGIKPCVSAFVGDQFVENNKHLVSKVYDLFYFSINFGSFFSTLLIPWVLPRYGSAVAFGIPGVLMAIATWIFWLGRDRYVHMPASGKENSSQFLAISFHGLLNRRVGASWLDSAKAKFGEARVEAVKAAWAIFAVFSSVVGFWALYDQTGSSWVIQAKQMDLVFLGTRFEASQIHALNPILIMLLIPVFTLGIYPLVENYGIRVTPLRKMGAGMFVTAFSFILVGFIQVLLDSGVVLNVGWQFFPYLLITAAEVMISITGLEFAYTQAPPSMKSTLMGLWFLTISAGNLLTAAISAANPFDGGASEFFFYAGLVTVVSVTFVLVAARYKERSYMGAV
jgi:proton-dependent oligopeptide transporter, POT family